MIIKTDSFYCNIKNVGRRITVESNLTPVSLCCALASKRELEALEMVKLALAEGEYKIR